MLTSLKQVKKGFTIIELLIVIAIIVILAGLVLTNIQGAQAQARDSARIQNIGSIRTQLEVYHNDNNAYPQTFTASDINAEEDALEDPRGSDSIEILAAVADEAAAETAVTGAVTDDTDGTAAYAYAAYPTGCTNDCTGYVLGTYTEQAQDDGNNYVIEIGLANE
ncbi:MAG: prepilin-type N-terminal cleavage/methylation domain-containing protein [Candidatus Saccharibacteria bacterium]|nr:prepilin-type N-terminal cleavage/methylation domain-containing protein [Candidatus Saccharibacteria bacterium]